MSGLYTLALTVQSIDVSKEIIEETFVDDVETWMGL